MTECILALDLGTTTGWACRQMTGPVVHGWSSFKPGRYEGGGMRYLRFKQWLTELKGTQRFDLNVHEKGTASEAGPVIMLSTPGS